MAEYLLGNVWDKVISDKYVTHFQPQYNNVTGEIIEFEALARLNDPQGLVSPGKFIAVLEENRRIAQFDLCIFESVCKFLKKAKEEHLNLVPVTMNISLYDFTEQGFFEKFDKIRIDYDIEPKYIRPEIHDAVTSDNLTVVKRIVNIFHQFGYTVSLDGFHGGYRSLNVLKEVEFDVIKLDMRYFQDYSDKGIAELSSIIQAIRKTNLTIVAEKVETRTQVEFLDSVGLRHVQGYYYSEPISEKDALKVLSIEGKDSSSVLLQQKLVEAEMYKKKFDNLLDQIDVYYWEYICETKEMYHCNRGIRDFGMGSIMYNCPESVIDSGVIARSYANDYIEMYRQIDAGATHTEMVVPIGRGDRMYIVRCDTEFDKQGKAVKAYCSAVRTTLK